MSRRTLRSDDVEGFIRAFNDEVRDTEEIYQVACEYSLRKGNLRGEIYIHGEASFTSPENGTQVVATADRVFPSPRVRDLHACLYQSAMSLNVAVQKWHHEKHRHWYSSPVEQPAK